MMADTIAILQARTTSRRLPDLILQPVAGEPLLQRMIERVLLCQRVDRLVIAASTDNSDDAVEALARRMNVECFRGAPDDVLDRFYQTACSCNADHIVRLTADCVLTDPVLVDEIIARYHTGRHEYCSNVTVRTFPLGLDVEVFSFAALQAAWRETPAGSDRRQVTGFLRRNPVRFVHGVVRDTCDRSQMRWIVEEPEDLEFVNRVFDRLYPFGINFTREDIYELLEECPELAAINSHRGSPRSRRRLAA
jgi:spore coat polysaccharide biosynthesis protein SpsF (cytidylyltransferase family)